MPDTDQEFTNRKLIRPSLTRAAAPHAAQSDGAAAAAPALAPERRQNLRHEKNASRAAASPEHTNAEYFYFQKQMQAHTPMVVVLTSAEQLHGTIEWFDKHCIKLARGSAGNVLIYKQAIRYLFKAGEKNGL
jgi:host factor-I protein